MRSALVLSLALVAAMVATPALAEDGNVPQTSLNSLGLSGLEVMSDSEGDQIRGRINGNGMVIGTSLISFQLLTPDTKNFINGSSVNMVQGDGQLGALEEFVIKSHGVGVTALTLDVSYPDGTRYLGILDGAVGGSGFTGFTANP